MVACLFVDDTVLLVESEGELQRVVDKFYNVCERRKLKVNVEKSKVMVFERREASESGGLILQCVGENEIKSACWEK